MQIVWYRLSEIYKEFLDIIIVGWRSLIMTVGEWTGRLSLFNIPSKFYSVYVLLWLHNYVRKRRAVDRARCCGWLCHVNGCRLLFHFFDIRASTYTVFIESILFLWSTVDDCFSLGSFIIENIYDCFFSSGSFIIGHLLIYKFIAYIQCFV